MNPRSLWNSFASRYRKKKRPRYLGEAKKAGPRVQGGLAAVSPVMVNKALTAHRKGETVPRGAGSRGTTQPIFTRTRGRQEAGRRASPLAARVTQGGATRPLGQPPISRASPDSDPCASAGRECGGISPACRCRGELTAQRHDGAGQGQEVLGASQIRSSSADQLVVLSMRMAAFFGSFDSAGLAMLARAL